MAASRPDEPVLEVRGLVKHFPLTKGILFKKQVGAVQAVDGIDLKLYKGETLGVVGESGCGKSTTARLLMRLEKPTAGQILFHGEDIAQLSGKALKAVRRNIQIVLQDPYSSLNPRMTVGDIVAEPFEIHKDVAPKGSRRKLVQSPPEMPIVPPQQQALAFARDAVGASDPQEPCSSALLQPDWLTDH